MRRHVFRKSLETPKLSQRQKRNVARLPFRARCRACVEVQARDGPYRPQEAGEKRAAEVLFDCGHLGANGEEETVAVQPPGGTRTRMLFADVVHRKGLFHEDGT